MNLSQFISTYNGHAVTYDNIDDNLGQCEQLVCFYWEKVYGFKCPMIPAAKDLWTNPVVLANFDRIPVGQEQAGDVGVFGASSAINSPEFGHTDIVVNKTASGYTGFDSNWGGVTDKHPGRGYGYPAAHEVQHSYTDVLGFLRKKGASSTTLTPEELAIADELYLVAFDHHIDTAGIKAAEGKSVIQQGERIRRSAEYKKGRKPS